MLFSSASSRKFVLLVLGALLYTYHRISLSSSEGLFDFEKLFAESQRTTIIICFVLACFVLTNEIFFKKIITGIYLKRFPDFVNHLGETWTIELPAILKVFKRSMLDPFNHLVKTIIVFLIVSILIIETDSFYFFSMLFFSSGIFLVIGILCFPNFNTNVRRYFNYYSMEDYGHFNSYKEYFSEINEKIITGWRMERSGLRWLVLFFNRMIPLHSLVFYLLFLFCLAQALLLDSGFNFMENSIAVFFLSLSPIMVGELTRGPQIARTYFPSFVGILLWIGYGSAQLHESLPADSKEILIRVWGVIVLVVLLWNFRVFITELLPSRMAVAHLKRKLDEFGISEFYTYDNSFNTAFVEVLIDQYPDKYKVKYIQSLSEVKTGYIVVPGTSAKALNMDSVRQGIEHGDFTDDPALNKIKKDKQIENLAIASFKNTGSSKYWVQDSEVTSYRELVVKDISDDDRWLAKGWLLDAEIIHAAGF